MKDYKPQLIDIKLPSIGIKNVQVSVNQGYLICTFKRQNAFNAQITSDTGYANMIVAYGSGELAYHGNNRNALAQKVFIGIPGIPTLPTISPTNPSSSSLTNPLSSQATNPTTNPPSNTTINTSSGSSTIAPSNPPTNPPSNKSTNPSTVQSTNSPTAQTTSATNTQTKSSTISSSTATYELGFITNTPACSEKQQKYEEAYQKIKQILDQLK